VIELTEPQIWTLIGVFTAAVIGMLSWQTIMFNRTLRTAIESVGTRIDALREITDLRLTSLEKKVDGLERKVDGLDRDVQALSRRVFGTDSP